LPGNPVSAFVTFLKFVRPAILKLMGANENELDLRKLPAILATDVANEGDRVHYVRGSCEGGRFNPMGRQESHALFGLSRANSILRVDAGQNLKQGDAVTAEIWD
jgi:molybdopterin molybdotransferase